MTSACFSRNIPALAGGVFNPRHVFQKLAQRHKTGRASRKFGFKEQFTVMAFIQLAARRSLRDATLA